MALIPCPDCGRQVSPMAKACPECGCGIAAPPPERRVRQDQEQNAGKKAAAGLASGVISFLLMRNYPSVGLLLIFMLISGAFGWWLGEKVLRSRSIWRAVFGWASLIVWLVPFLGVFASGAVWNGQQEGRPVTRERTLAVICLVLALINSTLGTIRGHPN